MAVMSYLEVAIFVLGIAALLVVFLAVEKLLFSKTLASAAQTPDAGPWFDRVLSNTGPSSIILFGFIFAEVAIPIAIAALAFARSPLARSNARWILLAGVLRASCVWLPILI